MIAIVFFRTARIERKNRWNGFSTMLRKRIGIRVGAFPSDQSL